MNSFRSMAAASRLALSYPAMEQRLKSGGRPVGG
jgi:hypothetical protein